MASQPSSASSDYGRIRDLLPELINLPQWVAFYLGEPDQKGKRTKIPKYETAGVLKNASTINSATWMKFYEAVKCAKRHNLAGIGFVFSKDDQFIGVDIDHCLDENGVLEPEAAALVATLNSYTEITPSGKGLHIIARGQLPGALKYKQFEFYCEGRYFTMTGNHYPGTPTVINECTSELTEIHAQFTAAREAERQQTQPLSTHSRTTINRNNRNNAVDVNERARKYIERLPMAVSGQNGHGATFRTACVLVQGFALDFGSARTLLAEWNQSHCQPTWSDRELDHKIKSAFSHHGNKPTGYLLDNDYYSHGAWDPACANDSNLETKVPFEVGMVVRPRGHQYKGKIVRIDDGEIEIFYKTRNVKVWYHEKDILPANTKLCHNLKEIEYKHEGTQEAMELNEDEQGEGTLSYLDHVIAGLCELKTDDENSPDRKAVEKRALELVETAAKLSKAELLEVENLLQEMGLASSWINKWRSAVVEKVKIARIEANTTDDNHSRSGSWPYSIENGRIVHLSQQTTMFGGTVTNSEPICDFFAEIVEESITEEGKKLFIIKGYAVRGGEFTCEINAENFSDDHLLKATLDAAAGARDPVHAGMVKHLGPAIKLLTKDNVRQTKRYLRTGWVGDKFLIPGREPEGITISLGRKLPYYINKEADLNIGLEALETLITCVQPERATIPIASIFLPPIAYHAKLRDERYAIAISGRSGSLKTSFVSACMCIYGKDFILETSLIKFGEGATRNAIMQMATSACDMPFFIDNFKPTTGGGSKDFVNLIHNVLEGSEKDRLTRSSTLRETLPIHAWPIITGEDIPDSDAASLARIIIVPFPWQAGEANEQLTKAQQLSSHLSAVGGVWLSWLESPEGQGIAYEVGKKFPETRKVWAERLRNIRKDMVNPLRVASNLASNELAWWIMERHPDIGEIAYRYSKAHLDGLGLIADDMATRTAESLEATRFLSALRELLATGRATLLPKGNNSQNESDRERAIGWLDSDGSAYLLPDVTRQVVDRLLGINGLGGISNNTLYSQLSALGAIASTSPGRHTKTLRVDAKMERVLHLKSTVINSETEEENNAVLQTCNR